MQLVFQDEEEEWIVLCFGTKQILNNKKDHFEAVQAERFHARLNSLLLEEQQANLKAELEGTKKMVKKNEEIKADMAYERHMTQSTNKILENPNLIINWLVNALVCFCLIWGDIDTGPRIYFVFLTVLFSGLLYNSISKNESKQPDDLLMAQNIY